MKDEWKIRPCSGGQCWYGSCGAPARFAGLWRRIEARQTHHQRWRFCHEHGKAWAAAKGLEIPWPDPEPVAYAPRQGTRLNPRALTHDPTDSRFMWGRNEP